MAKKELIPAPLDEKNVTTDWIEDLFDDQSALYSRHKRIGFMAGSVMLASWSGNVLVWKVLDGDSNEAFRKLHDRYWERYPEAESPFIVREQVTDNISTMKFYWKPE